MRKKIKDDNVYRFLKRFTTDVVHGGDFDQGNSLKDTLSVLKKWYNENKNIEIMRDQYMYHENVVDRLVTEYQLHGGLEVAYDFDNTVFDYHAKGESYDKVIGLIKKLSEVDGIKLTVWTGASKDRYDFVMEYLDSNGIPYNRINENPSFFNSTSPKIFYSILLDDRAGLESSYVALVDFLNRINVDYDG